MRTLATMSLPLAQNKRLDRELELAKLLATGRQIAGAIVFSSKYDTFEYLRSSGDTETPLDVQIPAIKSHDRELGPVVRGTTYRLHYVKSDIGYYARVFLRVIVGCPDVQVQGVVQYLNSEMRGNTLPAKFERYDELVWLCRCVLHPEHKYFTRRNKLKPYVWVPMPRPESKDVMTLADVVLNGDSKTAVQVILPTVRDKWPDIGQVRRTEPLAAKPPEPEAAQSAAVPQQLNPDLTKPSGSEKETAEEKEEAPLTEVILSRDNAAESEDMFATQDDEVEKELPPESDKTISAETGTAAYTEVTDAVLSENESPVTDGGLKEQAGQDGDLEHEGQLEPEEEPKETETPSSSPSDEEIHANTNDKSLHNESDYEEEIDDVEPVNNSHEEVEEETDETSVVDPILSGDVFGPNVPKVDSGDTRSLSLRRLHDELPRTKSGIPDAGKDKIGFTKLVHDIRKLEIAYYKEHKLEINLASLAPTKLLNKREAARELKHLHNLMSDRDVWLKERSVAAAKERLTAVKKANTKEGRMAQKRDLEKQEVERLSKQAEKPRGLALLGQYRRDKQEEADRKKAELDRDREATSSTAAKPKKTTTLSQLLDRQSQPGASADTSSSDSESVVARSDSVSSVGHNRKRNNKGCSVGFSGLGDTFDEVNGNNVSQADWNDDSFAKPAPPKCDSKSVTLMKELYRFTTAHSAEVLKLFDEQAKMMKTLAKEQARAKEKMSRLGENMRLLQKAFFDYDCQAHADLCDIEQELQAYLPVNELGDKTDFLFTHPAIARTIVKGVRTNLVGNGRFKPTLTKVVNEAASYCFSLQLRAHMHIVKRQKKQCPNNLGWWKVACPESFQAMIEKYLLPLCPTLNPSERSRGWKQRLYSHFCNMGATYFNTEAAATTTQKAFVLERYRLRRELQGMHFKPEVEGHSLVIPSLQQEEENYVRYSDNYDQPDDMGTTEKTQRSQRNELPKLKAPLPSMDELKELAKRLQDAMDANTAARKGQKRKMAQELYGNEVFTDEEGDLEISSTPDDIDDGQSAHDLGGMKGSGQFENLGDRGNTSFRSNDSAFNFDTSLLRQSSLEASPAAATQASAKAASQRSTQGKVTKLSTQYKRAKLATQ